MIEIEKAKELFLKYYRICKDVSQAKETSISFCQRFIDSAEDVDYWIGVKDEVAKIE